VFRTAYAISKMNLAISAQADVLLLQELNGINMGKVHRSHHSCEKNNLAYFHRDKADAVQQAEEATAACRSYFG